MQTQYSPLIRRSLCLAMLMTALLAAVRLDAYEADAYPVTTPLAQGKWVRISVPEAGLYSIDAATLRAWGFDNPANVRIYGNGSARIKDKLDRANAVTSLTLNHSETLPDGSVVFYGWGNRGWEASSGQRYHLQTSPYASEGYYLVTQLDDDGEHRVSAIGTPEVSAGAARTAQARMHIEKDLVQATEAGPLMVGESFRTKRTREYSISTPRIVPAEGVWMECQFVHTSYEGVGTLSFTVDGTPDVAMTTDQVPVTNASHYVHASICTTRHTLKPKNPDGFTLGVTYKPTGSPSMANLDYLSMCYTQRLEMGAGDVVEFWTNRSEVALSAPADTRVWMIAHDKATRPVNTGRDGDDITFNSGLSSMLGYVAWTPGAKLPAPSLVEYVTNQDLHAHILAEPADMVIFAPAQYADNARRIADLHRQLQDMEVRIVDPQQVYNEFAGGVADVSALRRYLKMAYDTSAGTDHPLAYALLLGRATMDQSEILAATTQNGYPQLPWWVVQSPRLSMSDNDGFGTDDFIAMLDDGAGADMGFDLLTISVGRIPMLTPQHGAQTVDKLEQYMRRQKKTGWKNRILVLADDEDRGVHLRQAEEMVGYIEGTPDQQHLIDKIYIDAYELSGGTYPQARQEMFRTLDEGVAWWIYTGHANNHSWTGEAMLTYTDINSLYLRNVPFVIASTCDFLRWDCETLSGGEIMYNERYGGAIGMISATRPVYISDNAYFLNAVGRSIAARDDDGRLYTAGQIYRHAKNDIRNGKDQRISNTNRLRFVFMGDPAMPLSTPHNIVQVNSINGLDPADETNQIVVGAMGRPEIKGTVTTPDGQTDTSFNGIVTVEIFDATTSRTTLAHGNGTEDTYDTHGDRLYTGSAPVSQGTFTLSAPMPSMVADNFRPATISLYAYATDSDAEAVGLNRQMYVYGLDEPVQPDTEAPVISTFMLNHNGFVSGDAVNTSPMVIATIGDNIGLNLSTAGVGHAMTLTLDGRQVYADVSSYFTPAADGSPSGVINYPLEGLAEGAHQLRLRIFDTSGNHTESTIDLWATDNLAVKIFDVYTDANPAVDQANFYITHDRPETLVEVTVTVYNLMGHPLWSGTAKGMSDDNTSAPVTWDLTDSAGRRVPRGIYLYRASITTDNTHFETSSRRIAVAGPR